MKDLAHSVRLLVRQPRYLLLATLTIAVGIGVNAAMFGLLDAVYFRPLPITEPGRLVDVSLDSPRSRFGTFSYEEFREIERDVPALKDVFAVGRRGVTLNRNGETELLLIHYVSGRYFPSLGIPMHLGRGFTPDDDRPEATVPRVVINHHVWQERLGAASDIIGRTIRLNSTPFTVIGVTAPGFVGLNRTVRTDVWVTTAQAPFVVPGLRDELDNPRQRWFEIIARLAEGADVERAAAELDVVLARWRASSPHEYQDARLVVRSQRETARTSTTQGAVLLALVGLVLLIACANVANLTLARGEGRSREMALRAALGATRLNLVRQSLLETAIVVLAGTVAGLLLASWVMQLFPALLPPGASALVLDVRLDARLFGFAVLLALLAIALVGLVPAWRGSRSDIASGLKSQPAGTARIGRGLQLRDILVVGEVAMSGVIVIAAGLLVRSFAYGLAVDPGFDSRKDVATFYVVPGLKGYDREATYRFLDAWRLRAGGVAGVKRVSYAIRLPAQGNEAGWSAAFAIPGREPPPGSDAFTIRYTMVGPDYFDVMGTRIIRGRGIGELDRPDSAAVAVISESMARRFWPGESPLGRHIRMGRKHTVDREIVGVAEDIRIGGLYEAPEMYVYVPYSQDPQGFGLLLVEAHDAAAVVGPVRQGLTEIDPAIPVLTVGSFAEHRNLLLYEERRNALMSLATALLALALGAVGVHGVVSLVTARRTREIGIRAALGAERGQLLRLLLGQGARLALAGTILGIAGGLAAGRLLRNQLHGVGPVDPWSLVLGVAVLVTVGLAASFAPAWRATRLDPAVALREE